MSRVVVVASGESVDDALIRQADAFERKKRDAKAQADAKHLDLIEAASGNPALEAVVRLHSPSMVGANPVCGGDDFEGYDAEYPDWPCRTIQTIAKARGNSYPGGIE